MIHDKEAVKTIKTFITVHKPVPMYILTFNRKLDQSEARISSLFTFKNNCHNTLLFPSLLYYSLILLPLVETDTMNA